MGSYRYSEWDGNQELFDLDADQVMSELGRLVSQYGDLSQALRALQRNGIRNSQGQQLPSLDGLLQQLRQMKRDHLDKYDLSSIMDEIRQRLDEILQTEREGIQQRLDNVRDKGETGAELSPEVRQRLITSVEERAAENREKLDSLPPDTGGQIRELTDYDFMDEREKPVQGIDGHAEEACHGAVWKRSGATDKEHGPGRHGQYTEPG